MTAVLGIDLSFTNTGLAILDDGWSHVGSVKTSPDDFANGIEGKLDRMNYISQGIEDFYYDALETLPGLIVLEGPSYGSQGSAAHDLGGLWWLAFASLPSSVPIIISSPSTRAKYATGKGNASKDAVLAAVVKRYLWIDIADNNVADAVVHAAIGKRHLGSPVEDSLPAANLAAMNGIQPV